MTKAELRKIYKDKRKALPPKERMKMDDLILIQFQRLILHDIHVLLSYWPIKLHLEVNTIPITDYVVFKIPGLRVSFPRTNFQNTSLQAIEVDRSTTYQMNHAGIAEPTEGEVLLPSEIDLIFVPLLTFDQQGYRLGYGKGFYDRFLPSCRPDAIKVGFSYFDPEEAIPERHEFDLPLDLAITPHRIYEF